MTPQQMQRVAVTGFLVVALVGICVSGLIVNFFAGMTFFGEPLKRGDLWHEVMASGLTAGLLLLSRPALKRLRPDSFLPLAAGVLAVMWSIDVLVSLLNLPGAPRGQGGEPWWWAPQFFFALPSTWPIVVLVLATPWVRGWWSPRRPAPRDRSAATGRPRST